MEDKDQCFTHPQGGVMSLGSDLFYCGWGEGQWLADPSQESISLYFPDFFLKDQTPWLCFPQSKLLNAEQLLTQLKYLEQEIPSLEWSSPSFAFFEKGYKELQQLFGQSKLKKGVPYTFEVSFQKMTLGKIRYIVQALLKKTSHFPIKIYGFWTENEGMLGGTPETLFTYNLKQSELKTMACAGTSRCPKTNLMESPKDLHEHQIVIEGIVQSLNHFGNVDVRQTEIIQVPHLAHLSTPIQVSLKAAPSFKTFVEALHPTPALGAFPRKEGNQWLLDLEKETPRKRYGAPVGFWDPLKQEGSSYVAIRNMQWDQQQCQIGAGCGVVEQSLLDQEWEEIKLKMNAIKKMLDL